MKLPIVRKKAIPAVESTPGVKGFAQRVLGKAKRRRRKNTPPASAMESLRAQVAKAAQDARAARPPASIAPKRAPRRAAPPVLDTPVREIEVHPSGLEPGAEDVRRRLLRTGTSASLADRIVQRVMLSGARGAYAIDAAAQVIGRSFPVRQSPKLAQAPACLVFVGPTGAGKTTTLAKLGRALVDAKRKVLFASLDSVGTSALESVGGVVADVDRTELPLVSLRRASDLRRALRRSPKREAILIDTPGLSPRDDAELDRLAAELKRFESKGTIEVYLVLPAGASRSSLEQTVRAFARMAPTAAVITKLDETNEPGTAVETALRAQLPLAFLCDGQDVRGHVMRPTPDRLADLMLRGKLS